MRYIGNNTRKSSKGGSGTREKEALKKLHAKEFHFVVEDSILAVTKKEIDHLTTGRQQEKESAADCSICFVLFL